MFCSNQSIIMQSYTDLWSKPSDCFLHYFYDNYRLASEYYTDQSLLALQSHIFSPGRKKTGIAPLGLIVYCCPGLRCKAHANFWKQPLFAGHSDEEYTVLDEAWHTTVNIVQPLEVYSYKELEFSGTESCNLCHSTLMKMTRNLLLINWAFAATTNVIYSVVITMSVCFHTFISTILLIELQADWAIMIVITNIITLLHQYVMFWMCFHKNQVYTLV